MIIVCPNCKKKFDIKDNLIPDKGRLLQCSSCNHSWYFTKQKEQKPAIQRISLNETSEDIPKETEQIIIEAEKIKKNNKKIIKKKGISILSIALIMLISFAAFIILLDTFKIQINNFFPDFIFFLENFYETLKDLYLFTMDLFRE